MISTWDLLTYEMVGKVLELGGGRSGGCDCVRRFKVREKVKEKKPLPNILG